MTIDPGQAHALMVEAAGILASCDPITAARVLADAARHQPPGGRLALARILVQSLAAGDAEFTDQLLADLRATPAVAVPTTHQAEHHHRRRHRHHQHRPIRP